MSQEIVVPETGEVVEEVDPSLVFGTKDPEGIIEKATKVATRLTDIVEKAKLYAMIKDKKYVKAEGWTTMAAMLGVFPRVVASERLERDEGYAYTAKVDLVTISGALVGSGEAICTSVERFGVGKDEYVVKSMAQTRALGKACRISFSWIMALTGYEVCPAEEMVADESTFRSIAMPKSKPVAPGVPEKVDLPAGSTGGDSQGPRAERPTSEELSAALKPPESKFYAMLKKAARERNIPDEKMKKAIKVLYGKDSSKELNDTQMAELLKLVEKGGVR